MLYRALGLLVSVLGGILAGAVFKEAMGNGVHQGGVGRRRGSRRDFRRGKGRSGPGRRQGFQENHWCRAWDVGRGCLPASRARRLLPHEAVSGCSAGQSGNRRRRRTALG